MSRRQRTTEAALPRPIIPVFVPCFIDQLWPAAGRAAVELIEALGFSVQVPGAVCCGQLYSNSGAEPDARLVRRQFERALTDRYEVVVLSASCAGYLHATRQHDGLRIVEFCDWVLRHAPARFPTRVERTCALHSSCSALRTTHTAGQARELLARVDGLRVVEPERPEECCGFGGTFATSFADLSVKMGQDKVADLVRERAGQDVDSVVSADCSCLLHLRGVGPERLAWFHIAELLNLAIR